MNTRGSSCYLLILLSAVLILLLSACQPGAPASNPQTAQPTAVLATAVNKSTQPAAESSTRITLGSTALDPAGLAQNVTFETVPAMDASQNALMGPMPQYTVLNLQGYPVGKHNLQPQIFIYPAGQLGTTNVNAGKMVSGLQTLLQSQQPAGDLPFLPLMNAKQVIHPQVKYLDFKNGQGVRFLTQYNQGPVPINNMQLIYTYQGLTRDGKYYVAVVMPVTSPDLPNDTKVNEQLMVDFPGYIAKSIDRMNQQPASNFTPDLTKLDALVQSIEIK